jgi:hypothetical protein
MENLTSQLNDTMLDTLIKLYQIKSKVLNSLI